MSAWLDSIWDADYFIFRERLGAICFNNNVFDLVFVAIVGFIF